MEFDYIVFTFIVTHPFIDNEIKTKVYPNHFLVEFSFNGKDYAYTQDSNNKFKLYVMGDPCPENVSSLEFISRLKERIDYDFNQVLGIN